MTKSFFSVSSNEFKCSWRITRPSCQGDHAFQQHIHDFFISILYSEFVRVGVAKANTRRMAAREKSRIVNSVNRLLGMENKN